MNAKKGNSAICPAKWTGAPISRRGSLAFGGNAIATTRKGKLTMAPAISTGAVTMAAGPWKASGAGALSYRYDAVVGGMTGLVRDPMMDVAILHVAAAGRL